jgi:hypothetical protein
VDYAVTTESGITGGVKVNKIDASLLNDDLIIEGFETAFFDSEVDDWDLVSGFKIADYARNQVEAAPDSKPEDICGEIRHELFDHFESQWQKKLPTMDVLVEDMDTLAIAMATSMRQLARSFSKNDKFKFPTDGGGGITYEDPLVGFRPQLMNYVVFVAERDHALLGLKPTGRTGGTVIRAEGPKNRAQKRADEKAKKATRKAAGRKK